MADNQDARRKAEHRFAASESRDATIRSEIAKQSAAFDARTIKLRAQRLAMEEEARIEKAKIDAAAPPKAVRTRKKAAAPKA